MKERVRPSPRLISCFCCMNASQVVAKVVGRRRLGGTGSAGGGKGGGDGEGGVLPSPLSDEERDVRVAELMSFGVDLPYEMLITLLR